MTFSEKVAAFLSPGPGAGAETELGPVQDGLRDALTGLPNRVFFTEFLERCVARAERQTDYCFAVLFLDIDRFKTVNDRLGHGVGDELLVAISRRLEICVRRGDVVSRMGGDEFTILLDDIGSISNATRVASQILEMISKPVKVTGHEIQTGASVGISLSHEGINNAAQLVRDADMAMYRAKEHGRGKYEVFDTTMHREAVARSRLEDELRNAIERREFRLMYQPVYRIDTEEIAGFEALVRWDHPERGMLKACEFIPVANDTGLITALTTWILRESCRQTAVWQQTWPKNPPLTISVNLCSREFIAPDLVERIADVLDQTEILPETLHLEITEGIISQSPERALRVTEQLRGIGVQLQLDDFGKGFSSLTYLHRYPVKALKIDREFVNLVNRGESDREIIFAITSLAKALNIDVIAEGIETVEVVRAMQRLGCCQFGQGYYYSRPLRESEATAALAKETAKNLQTA